MWSRLPLKQRLVVALAVVLAEVSAVLALQFAPACGLDAGRQTWQLQSRSEIEGATRGGQLHLRDFRLGIQRDLSIVHVSDSHQTSGMDVLRVVAFR